MCHPARRRTLFAAMMAVFVSGPLYAQEDLVRKQHLAEEIVAAREGLAQRWHNAETRRQLIEELAARPLAELEALAADSRREIGPRALGDTNQHLVFTPVVPCRIVDTRVAGGVMSPNETRDFKVTGVAHQAQGGSILGCGVPSGPTSAVLNIAAVGAAGTGHLRAWAYSTPPVGPPLAAVLTFGAGFNFSNGIPVPICDPTTTTCPFDLRMFAAGATVHVVIDVVGYFGGRAVTDADVAPGAAIAESKLALNFPTHSNVNDPTANEKAALAGTSGLPSGANAYVTNDDPRNTNARAPTVHGDASHDASVASLSGGRVPAAELGGGTASSTTFLRGDGIWDSLPIDTTTFFSFVPIPSTVGANTTLATISFTPLKAGTAVVTSRGYCNFNGGAAINELHIRAGTSAADAQGTPANTWGALLIPAGSPAVRHVQMWSSHREIPVTSGVAQTLSLFAYRQNGDTLDNCSGSFSVRTRF